MSEIVVLESKILVKKADRPKVTKGGVALPDATGSELVKVGKVIEAGPGRYLPNGTLIVNPVPVGSLVMYGRGATKFKANGEEYAVLDSADVLAVVGEGVEVKDA